MAELPGSDHRGRERVLLNPQGLPGTAVRGPACTVVWEPGGATLPATRLGRLWFWCRMLLIWKSVPAPLGAAEILQCRKRAMNGKGQLVNIGRGGRGLATEQTPEESWHPPWTDLQHPIATVNPTRNHLKLRRSSAANYGPTTIPPIVHIAGAPACCNQLGRQTPHQ